MKPDRRTFLKQTGAAMSAGAVTGPGAWIDPASGAAREGQAQPESGTGHVSSRALDPTLLRSLADTVLPESLGAAEREDAVLAFEAWLLGFQPVAELRHPYGGDLVPYGPPDPEPGWSAQLEALDLASRARHGSAFAELDRALRRAILDEHIDDDGEGFPAPARARHVAVGLMAHYFASPIAIDRSYGRRIESQACRSTDGVGDPPPPIGN